MYFESYAIYDNRNYIQNIILLNTFHIQIAVMYMLLHLLQEVFICRLYKYLFEYYIELSPVHELLCNGIQ